jgi:hypothetical protein
MKALPFLPALTTNLEFNERLLSAPLVWNLRRLFFYLVNVNDPAFSPRPLEEKTANHSHVVHANRRQGQSVFGESGSPADFHVSSAGQGTLLLGVVGVRAGLDFRLMRRAAIPAGVPSQ